MKISSDFPLDLRDERISGELKGFVPYGHVSLYDSKGYLSDKYEDMITQVGHENFDNLVNSLPEVLKKGVSSAYEKLTNDRSYQDARNLEEDVRYFLELRDLEKRLAKKENEVVSSFGRSLHVDSDLMAEAESKYLGTQEYRERFKKAVESDPLLYSRLERVRYELGTDIVNMAGAREILYGNLYSLPDSPLGKKELVRELVKEGMVFQAGEYPTIRKELPPPIIPVEKEKKEHPHLKKIFAIGAALTITGTGITALAGQLAKNDAGYYHRQKVCLFI